MAVTHSPRSRRRLIIWERRYAWNVRRYTQALARLDQGKATADEVYHIKQQIELCERTIRKWAERAGRPQ